MIAKLSIVSVALLSITTLALADRRHRRPPKEAVDACASKSAGDACTFAHDSHDITGTCSGPPAGATGPLACKPDQPPPPPREAVDACAHSARGDACSFQIDDQALAGTCDGPADKPLACRPSDAP